MSGGGLQPERTSLAWQRTTVGVLTNGALLLFREARPGARQLPSLVLAAAALVLAVGLAVVGWQRNRLLTRTPAGPRRLPSRGVAVAGWGVAALCLGGVVVLALPA